MAFDKDVARPNLPDLTKLAEGVAGLHELTEVQACRIIGTMLATARQ